MPESTQNIFLPTKQEVQEANKTKVENPFFSKIIKHLKTTGQIAMLSTVMTVACDKAENKAISTEPSNTTQTKQNAESNTATPENASQKIAITLDPSIDNSPSRSGRTIEQTKQTIIEVAQKAPLPTTIEVKIVPGTKESSDHTNAKIEIGRDHIRVETERFEIAHEIGHILDIEQNQKFFEEHYTPEQITELKKLRAAALADSFWGRDYPSVKKIMSNKTNTNPIPRDGYTAEQIAAGVKIYANGVWIEGKKSPKSESFDPFNEDIKTTRDFIETIPKTDTRIESIEQFSETHIQELADFFNSSPLVQEAASEWYASKEAGLFDNTNAVWGSDTPSDAYLSAVIDRDWWSVVYRETEMILFEKYQKGELVDFLNKLSPDKRKFIEEGFKFKVQISDTELFPELFKIELLAGIETSLRPYMKKLREFNKTNNAEEAKGAWQTRQADFDKTNNLSSVG